MKNLVPCASHDSYVTEQCTHKIKPGREFNVVVRINSRYVDFDTKYLRSNSLVLFIQK